MINARPKGMNARPAAGRRSVPGVPSFSSQQTTKDPVMAAAMESMGFSLEALGQAPKQPQQQAQSAPKVTASLAPANKPVSMSQQMASMGAKAPAEVNKNAPILEVPDAVFTAIYNMVSGFADIDQAVVKKNHDMLLSGKIPPIDRQLSFELVDYLFTNAGYILSGLLISPDFRTQFINGLMSEMSFDNKTEEEKKAYREAEKDERTFEYSGYITIGVTEFNQKIRAKYIKAMNDNFQKIINMDSETGEKMKALSAVDRKQLGAIFGNYVYMIRLFARNDMFTNYVVTVTESVKKAMVS